jgi:hypothetical protein
MPTLLLDRAASPTTAGDPILLHAFARRGRPLSAGDLLRAMTGTGARPSDVMDLLTGALAAGMLERHGHRRDEAGAPAGPLLYALTGDGQAAVEADRLV